MDTDTAVNNGTLAISCSNGAGISEAFTANYFGTKYLYILNGNGIKTTANVTNGNNTITIDHTNSVTAETTGKGSSTAIPIIKYDAQGHITSVTTATVYPPTTAGTNGQVWKSDGSGQGVWTNQANLSVGSAAALTSAGQIALLKVYYLIQSY